ncbi:MAG: glycoside hydrolase family 2 TIM barrel-domain containing protein [Chitinophagales bacterium]
MKFLLLLIPTIIIYVSYEELSYHLMNFNEKSITYPVPPVHFVSVKNGRFEVSGKPYYFLGANFWAAMNLASKGEGGDRERLIRELDHLQSLGIRNLRIMAASEGPNTEPWRAVPAVQPAAGVYEEKLLDGLDFVLSEMGKRGMYAVLCLNNYWPWTGGMAQYNAWFSDEKQIPYPPPAKGGNWLKYMCFSSQFFKNKKAIDAYHQYIEMLISRRNNYTGSPYKDDPTIFSWQLANEPRGVLVGNAYYRWVKNTARFIKKLDSNHLVSVGSEGNAVVPFSRKFKKEHSFKEIDYTTAHIWAQNWTWYDPTQPEKDFEKALEKAKKYFSSHLKMAEKMNKPLVLEEFGLARDEGSYASTSSTQWRDRYFRELFTLVHEWAEQGRAIAGCNFWAWSGEGRPRHPKAVWKKGDDFTGDPPFEHQGWYSVYDTDSSSLELCREFAEQMEGLK